MAYDAERGETVLFGGSKNSANLSDTWTWNGATWKKRTPASSPPARSYTALAYDGARGKALLFAGAAGSLLDDTWEWDGATWTQVALAQRPSARSNHAMAYDGARGEVVLFGGERSGTSLQDTWTYHVRGGACSCPGGGNCVSTACDTGYCVDGVCCEGESLGVTSPPDCRACERCDTALSPGLCATVTNVEDAPLCAGPKSCDATGACKKKEGESCGAPGECVSGSCADGVCCDAACDGACDRCDGAKLGWSGAKDGTCAIAPGQYPGDPPCPEYTCSGMTAACDRTTCSSDEHCQSGYYCDAGGRCSSVKPLGGSCDTAAGADCKDTGCRVCGGLPCVDGYCCENACQGECDACDATGACTVVAKGSPGAPSCAPQLCDGVSASCGASCQGDTDCAAGAYCDAGTCKGQGQSGASCRLGAECASGFCADGVCCNAACQGQCEACAEPGSEGACTPVAGEPRGGRPACAAGTVENPCAAASCDGAERASCAGLAGSSVVCHAASCSGDVATLLERCDGTGVCPAVRTKKCEPYVCAGDACGEAPCETDADCSSKFKCAAPAGKTEKDCIPRDVATCDGDHTVTAADGVSTTDCTPYRCESNGECMDGCSSIDDCVAPNVCDTNGKCVPPPELMEADEGGCGCRAVGGSGGGGGPERAALLLAALAGLAAARRRRAGQRHAAA
ncbi:MAG: kelch repeat-containing protein [Sorangiineae bacterium]|nr:kelch repeat-containing protein [Sorangiineae bacterium]